MATSEENLCQKDAEIYNLKKNFMYLLQRTTIKGNPLQGNPKEREEV